MLTARRLPLYAWLVSCLLALRLVWRARGEDQRLYWEYGGRLIHRGFTPNFVEWVQHRAGGYVDVAQTVLAPHALAPYTGFPCEYPPGVLALFAFTRFIADDPSTFNIVYDLISGACGIAAAGLAWFTIRDFPFRTRASYFAGLALLAIWPQLVGSFAVSKFDTVATLMVAGAFLAARQKRPGWCGALLGLGGAVKLWPVLLVIFACIHVWRTRNFGQAILCGVASVAAFLLPHLATLAAGTAPGDMFAYLRFLRDRPLQIESFAGNFAVVLHLLTGSPDVTSRFDFGSYGVYFDGSQRIIALASALNLAGYAGLILIALLRLRQGAEPRAALLLALMLSAACVALTMLCSRVFSGEYLLWLVPFVLVTAVDGLGIVAAALYVVAQIALKVTYKAHIEDMGSTATLACFLKNLCVAGDMLIFLIVAGRRFPNRPPAAS